jgi:hypothetical protein
MSRAGVDHCNPFGGPTLGVRAIVPALYLLLGETFAAKVGQARQSCLLQHCVELFQGSLCHVPERART